MDEVHQAIQQRLGLWQRTDEASELERRIARAEASIAEIKHAHAGIAEARDWQNEAPSRARSALQQTRTATTRQLEANDAALTAAESWLPAAPLTELSGTSRTDPAQIVDLPAIEAQVASHRAPAPDPRTHLATTPDLEHGHWLRSGAGGSSAARSRQAVSRREATSTRSAYRA